MAIRMDDVQAEQARDVFDFALQSFIEKHPAGQTTVYQNFATIFTNFARDLYAANRPVGTDYMGSSIALRFQDGTVLPFVDAEDGMPGVGGVSGGLSMARPENLRPRGGKGTTVATANFPVTGNDNKS